MSYEAGSKECRHLIEEIYNKVEQMHDNRKKLESTTNYL